MEVHPELGFLRGKNGEVEAIVLHSEILCKTSTKTVKLSFSAWLHHSTVPTSSASHQFISPSWLAPGKTGTPRTSQPLSILAHCSLVLICIFLVNGGWTSFQRVSPRSSSFPESSHGKPSLHRERCSALPLGLWSSVENLLYRIMISKWIRAAWESQPKKAFSSVRDKRQADFRET